METAMIPFLVVPAIALLFLLPAFAARAQQMPGTPIDIGGYRVHLYCTGAGTPAVLIAGGFSFDWARVCTYDASGNAWSDPGPAPTCLGRVDEIHRLVRSAKLDVPFVLAGFSAGALFARICARDYPDEVAAMVLIDHAFLPARQPPPPVTGGPDSPPALISATPIDIGAEDEPGFDRLPEEIRRLHAWAMSRRPARPDAELQMRLLALSHNSRQIVADRSSHSIEISQPAVAVEAIREAVEATRK